MKVGATALNDDAAQVLRHLARLLFPLIAELGNFFSSDEADLESALDIAAVLQIGARRFERIERAQLRDEVIE